MGFGTSAPAPVPRAPAGTDEPAHTLMLAPAWTDIAALVPISVPPSETAARLALVWSERLPAACTSVGPAESSMTEPSVVRLAPDPPRPAEAPKVIRVFAWGTATW